MTCHPFLTLKIFGKAGDLSTWDLAYTTRGFFSSAFRFPHYIPLRLCLLLTGFSSCQVKHLMVIGGAGMPSCLSLRCCVAEPPTAPQVYAVALYVEADTARAELQRLRAEGFFSEGYSDDRVMEALLRGRSDSLVQLKIPCCLMMTIRAVVMIHSHA